SAASLSAQTVAYWRFEEGALLADSGVNNHTLAQPGSGTSFASVNRDANPGDTQGLLFPDPIPRTGAANTDGLFKSNTSTGYLRTPDHANFALNAFTLELFLGLKSIGSNAGFLAGHFNAGSHLRSYAMILSSAGELGVALSANGADATQYYSGFTLSLENDYYLAVAVNTSAEVAERSITFFMQDLTRGGALQSVTITGASVVESALFNSSAPFSIGAQGVGGSVTAFSGYLDEVRLSSGL